MNSYLAIAAKVLEQARQPLSPRQILQAAYQSQIVPSELYGKTQHKTLHARLAEDIRRNITRSDFYRTQPGRFYLRKFLNETAKHKGHAREYRAPVRADQLKNFYALCFERSDLMKISMARGTQACLSDLTGRNYSYLKLSAMRAHSAKCAMRIMVVLKRSDEVLVHRSFSQFGDQLDGTVSLGIIGFVKRHDKTLFSSDEWGLEEAASRALAEQLYLPYTVINDLQLVEKIHDMPCLIPASFDEVDNAFVVALIYNCPIESALDIALSRVGGSKWEERFDRLNHLDDFDPWSRSLIQQKYLCSATAQ